MIECSVYQLNKFYGANKIFENITFEIKTGERIGLIGQNGVGKTTLMKILMGKEAYQEGTLSYRKDCKIGYLEQIFNFDEGASVNDVLALAFKEIFDIKDKMKICETEMMEITDENRLNEVITRYGKHTEAFERLGGYQVETQINKVAQGLNINEAMRQLPFRQLSGGEKTRVALGRLLLEAPDILLLDEPSNHLDIASIEWLEDFLKDYAGAVLIISHDRYFLDETVTKIIELEPMRAVEYFGNYSYYVEEKERRFLIEYSHYKNQQKKIERMEQQIERYRIWGNMRDSEVMYKRAKELEKRLEKIDVLDRPKEESKKIVLEAEINKRTGNRVLQVDNLTKYYDERQLLEGIDFTLFYQDKCCIVGENGCGKTTLLKLIMGIIPPDGGTIVLGSNIKLGYLSQNIVFENEEETILEYFTTNHRLSEGQARGYLAKALFLKEDVFKKIKVLSGGEKSRLKLCSMTFEKVNFMILDEPTNHLDIDSREVLEETLRNFQGTLLFVSHDRYFINKVANKIMCIENRHLKVYPYDYQGYLSERAKEEKKEEDNRVKASPPARIARSSRERENTKKPDLKEVEEKIEGLEKELKAVQRKMEENANHAERLNGMYIEKQEIEEALESEYAKWMAIQE